jgi:hypothetical protein
VISRYLPQIFDDFDSTLGTSCGRLIAGREEAAGICGFDRAERADDEPAYGNVIASRRHLTKS